MAAIETLEQQADSPAAVLAAVQAEQATAHRAEIRILELAADWAAMHEIDSSSPLLFEQPARFTGKGVPEIGEFCVPELATVLHLSHEAAGSLIADALELTHRPGVRVGDNHDAILGGLRLRRSRHIEIAGGEQLTSSLRPWRAAAKLNASIRSRPQLVSRIDALVPPQQLVHVIRMRPAEIAHLAAVVEHSKHTPHSLDVVELHLQRVIGGALEQGDLKAQERVGSLA